MRHRIFSLISQARRDLQLAEELAKHEVVDAATSEETAEELAEARARVLALEARVAAIEQWSDE